MYDTSLPLNLTRRPGEMEDFQKGGTNDVYTDCLQRDEMISNYLETQSLYEASRCRMPVLTHVSEEGKATGMNSQPKVVDSAGPLRLSTSNNSYYSTPWSTTMYPRPVYPVYIGESLSPHSHPSSVPSSCMYQRDLCQNFRNYAANQWIQGYQDPTMRSRPSFTKQQTDQLETEFNTSQYITRRRRIEIAFALNLTEKQIKTWFQNRRVKERKIKK